MPHPPLRRLPPLVLSALPPLLVLLTLASTYMFTVSAQEPPLPTATPTPQADAEGSDLPDPLPVPTATPMPGATPTPEPDSAVGGAGGTSVPAISITPYKADVTEGTTLYFKLTASSAPAANLKVRVHVWQSGSFLTGTIPTEVTLAKGRTTAWVILRTANDKMDERDGRVAVYVIARTGYTAGKPSVASTIVRDNDEPPATTPTVTITRHKTSVTEGDTVYFKLTATSAPASRINVKVRVTQTGKFITGTTPTSVALTGTTAWVIVRTANDRTDERDGSIRVTLRSGTGYKVGRPSSATTTVKDNDDAPTPTPTPRPIVLSGVSDMTAVRGDTFTRTLPTASGGSGRFTYLISGLPPGLRLGGRTISGTPTRAGAFDVTYTARDRADSRTARRSFRIAVLNPTPTPTPTVTVPADPCVAALKVTDGETKQSGRWVDSCKAAHRGQANARFYTFSLPTERFVRIDLTSNIDPYLYLLKGTGKSGAIVTHDDDGGVGKNSRIERLLPASAYTVEATTYSQGGKAGAFNLSIQSSPPPEVTITADKLLPAKGDTVVLTAQIVNPLSGRTPTYKWEERVGTTWKRLTTTSSTHRVTSAAAAVRTFRATATYAGLSISASDTAPIVWDELSLYDSLLDDVVTRVTKEYAKDATIPASAQAYRTAEAAFLKCVNGTKGITETYTSVAQVMGAYRSTVKAAVDACEGENHKYFGAMQAAFKLGIGEIRGSGTLRDLLLQTDRGKVFISSVGDPAVAKPFASLFSTQGQPIGDVIGASDHEEIKGLDCFNHINRLGKSVNNASDGAKYAALNCITRTTAHSFWVDLETEGSAERTAYLKAFCLDPDRKWGESCHFIEKKDGTTESKNKYNWVNYGDLKCSVPGEGLEPITAQDESVSFYNFIVSRIKSLSLAACLKHDLTWAGLQGIQGGNTHDTSDDGILDSAWHPRNKLLSDVKFYIDQACQGDEYDDCVDDDEKYWKETTKIRLWSAIYHAVAGRIAPVAFYGVAQVNHKHWPITEQDFAHTEDDPYYRPCADVPHLKNIKVQKSGTGYVVRADIDSGCIPGIKIVKAQCFVGLLPCSSDNPAITNDRVNFTIKRGSQTRFRFLLFPADRVYGGQAYAREYVLRVQ